MKRRLMKAFIAKDTGSVFAEYALLLSLIAVLSIAAITALGGRIVDLFAAIEFAMSGI